MKLATSVLALALVGSAFAAACSNSPKGKTAPQPTVAPTETALAEALPTAAPTDTGAATSAPTASGTPTTQPTTAPPAKPDWASMTKDQKMDVMKNAVMPKMTTEFQAADAKRYAKFSCATCHGAGAKDGKFAMPNAGLPKLTTENKFAAEMKKSPKVTKFMMEQVVPDMAAALGVAPYDPATKQGFGCFNCHTPKAATKS
jgi:hypothetical protein